MQLRGEYLVHGHFFAMNCTQSDMENSMKQAKFPGLIGDTVLPNECLSRTHFLT